MDFPPIYRVCLTVSGGRQQAAAEFGIHSLLQLPERQGSRDWSLLEEKWFLSDFFAYFREGLGGSTFWASGSARPPTFQSVALWEEVQVFYPSGVK